MVRGLKKVAHLTRSEPLPGGMTKSGYIRERVSNLIAPGFPQKNRAVAAATNGAEKEKAIEADPMSSLLGGYKAPEKRSKEAMYAAPPQVRHLVAQVQIRERSAAQRASRMFWRASMRPLQLGVPTTLSSLPPPAHLDCRHIALLQPRQPLAAVQSVLLRRFCLERRTSHQPSPPRSCARPRLVSLVHLHPLLAYRLAGRFIQGLPRVDSREGTREHGKRVELCEKIEREGVRVDGKMMPLGDMIWVAKKVDPATGRPTGGDDVVLDAIVERKRLDDLCTSIIDGRYVGQKFRLKDSGISHRIYLIEKYDVAAQYEKFGKQIWTCKSQLQVNDGFLVHESANMADTINWLKKRTQVMSEMYESQELHVIPDSHIDRTSYLALQQHLRQRSPATVHHTTYSSFCALDRPDAALTLRTQWASMIQRVSGVSAEKAVQFLGRWETPRQFWKEACGHELEVERENEALEASAAGAKGKRQPKKRKAEDFVFEELDDGGTRGIKGKLGAKIWELFMAEGERYADS
ncbi:Crossover junction endonuclease mus-81 [Rhodotorula toruloides]|nr:Crossover junction endonuclease mus-81 [Rhodotorula toruloides]